MAVMATFKSTDAGWLLHFGKRSDKTTRFGYEGHDPSLLKLISSTIDAGLEGSLRTQGWLIQSIQQERHAKNSGHLELSMSAPRSIVSRFSTAGGLRFTAWGSRLFFKDLVYSIQTGSVSGSGTCYKHPSRIKYI